MELTSRIYLVGFMGSGKTHSGKALALAIGYAFADLDDLIVQAAGCSIPALFASKGEPFFRALEKEVLEQTIQLDRYVIACGGGTPCFFDNMQWINAQGISMYLKASADLLVARLLPEQNHRPVLQQAGPLGLEAFVRQKLAERQRFYEQARWIYDQDRETDSLATFLQKQLTV
ncbi:MAG: shikimate kinase [Haliscomenobacter sp.]|nr:shikimate kinase [Haliscomenobacter sp.]MBK8653599.1 shikimate kinase [Haliscomenobacter sp.]MBP9077636.1 shikimate kinase [Haliscomenobacter sp.]MBP9874126.1 shikimate kinase [Haliscomenobacter sp.]